MKLTVLCIDGLGLETLEVLGLSNLKKRVSANKVFLPKIRNVVSRGWTEIYTGQTAYENGAYYQIPIFKKNRIKASQETGYNMLASSSSSIPMLWDELKKLGLSVGVFTVPTVPVLKRSVTFSIGATGGGKFGNNLSLDDVFPKSLFSSEEILNVDLGLRMGFGGYIPDDIIEFTAYAEKHLNDYFRLLSLALTRKPVDVGIIGTRFINEIGYKFLGLLSKIAPNEKERLFKSKIMMLCKKFDEELEQFLQYHNPENIFIVSDHGITNFKYELNINEYLTRLNYIQKSRGKYHWKVLLHPIYRVKEKFLHGRKRSFPFPRYDLENSKIFSIGFTNLIYLNDDRFAGPKIEENAREDMLDTITDHLNRKKNDLIGMDGLYFERLRQNKHGTLSPDIICKMPPGTTNTQRRFDIVHNVAPNYPNMFSLGFHGEYSGCKSEDTLSSYSGNSSDVVILDLTDTFSAILTIANEIKR